MINKRPSPSRTPNKNAGDSPGADEGDVITSSWSRIRDGVGGRSVGRGQSTLNDGGVSASNERNVVPKHASSVLLKYNRGRDVRSGSIRPSELVDGQNTSSVTG